MMVLSFLKSLFGIGLLNGKILINSVVVILVVGFIILRVINVS